MSITTNTFVLVCAVSVFFYIGTVINSASSSCLAVDGDFEVCFEAMAQKMDWFAFSSVILGVSVIAYVFHPESKAEEAEEGDDAGTPPPLERTRLPSYDDSGGSCGGDENLAPPPLGFRRSNSNSSLDYLLVGSASSSEVGRPSPFADSIDRSREVEVDENNSIINKSNNNNTSSSNNNNISSRSSSDCSSSSNCKDTIHKDIAHIRLEQIRQNWKVYDKIYGVIPQETYELWRNNETSKQNDSICTVGNETNQAKFTFESSNIDSSCNISSNFCAARKVPPIRYRKNS